MVSLGDKGFVGTYDEFVDQLSTDENKGKLHQYMTQNLGYTKGYDDFIGQFFKKKSHDGDSGNLSSDTLSATDAPTAENSSNQNQVPSNTAEFFDLLKTAYQRDKEEVSLQSVPPKGAQPPDEGVDIIQQNILPEQTASESTAVQTPVSVEGPVPYSITGEENPFESGYALREEEEPNLLDKQVRNRKTKEGQGKEDFASLMAYAKRAGEQKEYAMSIIKSEFGDDIFDQLREDEAALIKEDTEENREKFKNKYDKVLGHPEFSQIIKADKALENTFQANKDLEQSNPDYAFLKHWTKERQKTVDQWSKEGKIGKLTLNWGSRLMGKLIHQTAAFPKNVAEAFGVDTNIGITPEGKIFEALGFVAEDASQRVQTDFPKPSKLQRQLYENVANFEGKQVITDNGKIQNVRDDNGFVVEVDDNFEERFNKSGVKSEKRFTGSDVLLSTVADVTADLAMMMAIGRGYSGVVKGLGAGMKTSAKAGTLLAVTHQLQANAYDEAIENGLSPGNAARYALITSAGIGAINTFVGGLESKLVQGSATNAGRMSVEAARKAAGKININKIKIATLKGAAKDLLGEVAEEAVFEQVYTNFVKTGFNALTDSNFDTKFNWDEARDAAIITPVVSLLPALGGNIQNYNASIKDALLLAVDKPEAFSAHVQTMVEQGVLTPEEAETRIKQIDRVRDQVSKLKDQSDEKRREIIPMLLESNRIREEAETSEIVAVKQQKEKEIKELDDQISQTLYGEEKIEDSKTPTETQEEKETTENQPIESQKLGGKVNLPQELNENIDTESEEKVSLPLGQTVRFEGFTGTLKQEGGQLVVDDGQKIVEIPAEKQSSIEPVQVEADQINIGGKKVGFKSVNTNDQGDIVSLTVIEDGKEKTIRDPDLALKVDIERNKIPNEYQLEKEEERQRFESDVKNAAVKLTGSTDQEVDKVNTLLDTTSTAAVDKVLDDMTTATQDELIEAVIWVEEVQGKLKEIDSEYARETIQSLENFKTTIQDYERNFVQRKIDDEASFTPKAERGSDNNVLERATVYTGAKQSEGKPGTRVTPEGKSVKGRWKVVDANTLTPSHNPETFQMNTGFPTVDGKTANDRDYENDKVAQGEVNKMAGNFDQRALQDTPVVSEEGVVLSGNNRTMSRQLAAKKGTDQKYLEALEQSAKEKGIDSIEGIENPILIFEQEGDVDYSTVTFAQWNASEKKAKSQTDKAITVSRNVPDNVRQFVGGVIERFENMWEFNKSRKAISEVIDMLIKNRVIQTSDLNDYVDSDTGNLTQQGKDLVETILITGVVDEDTVKLLNQEGLKSLRQKIVKSIVPLTKVQSLGAEYHLKDNLANAVKIHNELQSSGQTLSEWMTQGDMFGGKDKYSAADIMMAQLLEHTQIQFKKDIEQYLVSAESSSGSMFAESSLERKEILNKIAQDERINLDKPAQPESDKGLDDHIRQHESNAGFGPGFVAGQFSEILGFDVSSTFGKFSEWIKRQFRARGLMPSEVFSLKLQKDGKLNRVEREVQQNARLLRKAIKKAYVKPSPEILKKIDGALKGDLYDIAEIDASIHPFIFRLRNHIDSLSRALIESGATDGELDITISENLGMYVSRSYQVFDDPKWIDKVPVDVFNRAVAFVRDDIQSQIDAYKSKDPLTKQERQRLTDLEIKVKFNADGKDLTAAELTRLAELQAKSKKDPLTDKQKEHLEFLEKKLKNVPAFVESLLVNKEAPQALVSGGKEGSKDLKVLRKRKNIPKEIRELYGEYEDPLVNYARSATKIAAILHNHTFLEEVLKVGEGKFLFKEEDMKPGFTTSLAAEGANTFSPLNGYYTSKEIKESFDRALGDKYAPKYLKTYMKANGLVKYSKTILSHSTHIRNVIGNIGFMVANGHSPKFAFKAIQAISANMGANASKDVERKYFNRLVELGVLYESPRAGELRDVIKDATGGQGIFDIDTFSDNRYARYAKQGKKLAENLYQAEDDFFKIMAFENEKARYAKALYGAKFDQLNPAQKEDVEKRSAEIVRMTYPTYSLIPEWAKNLRRFPLMGTFISFPYEVLRTTFNTIHLARQEIKNPQTRNIGITRFIGMGASLAMGTVAAATAKLLLGIGSDEDDDYRNFMPDWDKDGEIVYLPDEKGALTYINLTQMDPHAMLKQPVYAFMYGDGPTNENLKTALHSILRPFITEEILLKHIDEAYNNKKRNGGKVYNDVDLPSVKLEKSMAYIMQAFEPGSSRSIRRLVESFQDQSHKDYGKLNPKYEALANAGIRITSTDINRQLGFKARNWSKAKSDARYIFNKVKSKKGQTKEDLKKAYDQSNEAYQRVFKQIVRDVSAAQRLGVNDKSIASHLKDYGFNNREVAHILAGQIPDVQFTK